MALVLAAVSRFFKDLEPLGKLLGPVWRRRIAVRRERELPERSLAFVGRVRRRIELVNIDEDWQDEYFAELETWVELRHTYRRRRLVAFFGRRGDAQLRRMPLSKALGTILEPTGAQALVLLEGDPGSGKSVALRHLALELCRKLESSLRRGLIPVYVNLRRLDIEGRSVNADTIQELVLRTLGHEDDAEARKFLDDEFDAIARRGEWLFLFDSFDEIPELLSATEADAAVRHYEDALSEFLVRMSRCGGIVASRHYRGPRRQHWPSLRILGLTEERKHELARARMSPDDFKLLFGSLPRADAGLQLLSANPLFLGLLCQYVQQRHEFPGNCHRVFEAYYTPRVS